MTAANLRFIPIRKSPTSLCRRMLVTRIAMCSGRRRGLPSRPNAPTRPSTRQSRHCSRCTGTSVSPAPFLVQASCHGTDNAAMLDMIAADPERVRGIAMVRPEITPDELCALHKGGVRGVRFNFVAHLGKDADLDAVRTTAAKIADLGWHAVVHFDAAKLPELAPFLRELPVPMVIDHMGRVDARAGSIRSLSGCCSISWRTSGSG